VRKIKNYFSISLSSSPFFFSVAILQFQIQVEDAASNLSDLKSSFVAEEVSGIDRGSKKFVAMLS